MNKEIAILAKGRITPMINTSVYPSFSILKYRIKSIKDYYLTAYHLFPTDKIKNDPRNFNINNFSFNSCACQPNKRKKSVKFAWVLPLSRLRL